MNHWLLRCTLLLCLSIYYTAGFADISQRADVQKYIKEMQHKHHFDPLQLRKLFQQVTISDRTLKLMYNRPARKKAWYDYKKIFFNPTTINGGLAFWQQHAATLARAEKIYGVPASIIVAIIGIESNYGGYTGQHKIIDGLATLSFAFPSRAKFFRFELTEFLLLCRKKHWNPLHPRGSYAGAMGTLQFMPHALRRYAVDFSGDKKVDLDNNMSDIIGSIAYYLQQHGWHRNETVAVAATIDGATIPKLDAKKDLTLTTFATMGIRPKKTPTIAKQARLLSLARTAKQQEHWLTFHNFQTIKRYNSSPMYALSAHLLSQRIATLYAAKAQPAYV